MPIKAIVEFHDQAWRVVATKEQTFPDRAAALRWLLAQHGRFVGWLGDGTFGIVQL